MTGVTHSLLTHLLSPCSQFDQILWCQDPSLGGLDTTVGATEVLGTTPHPTALRGTELPSPAGFPPRPMATPGLLGCCAGGRKEHGQQAKVSCSPYLCWLLGQKDCAGGAASALPGERKRRLEAGTGRLGSSQHSTRAAPQMLQDCGNINA